MPIGPAKSFTQRHPYNDWARAQNVPIVEDFGIDIRKVPVKKWDRFGMDGALCHLKGRDDFISIFAFELPPGGKSAVIRHIYEEVIYVLEGQGSTQLEFPDGSKRSFEWGQRGMFAIPLNAKYRHFNTSGRERVVFDQQRYSLTEPGVQTDQDIVVRRLGPATSTFTVDYATFHQQVLALGS